MKMLCAFLISFIFAISGIAGNEAGGGGHICKSQVAIYFENIVKTINNDPEILQNYPEWTNLQFVMNPSKNPNFKIEIMANPIKNCPNTENALACGQPNKNKIQIYCGEDGWNSLGMEEKYRQIIHEVYWWSNLDDTNYFYSNKLLNEIYGIIISNELVSQKPIILRQGDVNSLEVLLNKIDLCEPVNIYGNVGRWEKKDENLICKPSSTRGYSENECSFDFTMNYTVVVNNEFTIEINRNSRIEPGANQGSLPVGTVFSLEVCKSQIRKAIFPAQSLNWFQSFENVQSGIIQTSGRGREKSCYKNVFQGGYDPTSGNIAAYSFNRLYFDCEHQKN